jgi:hypothetical protein
MEEIMLLFKKMRLMNKNVFLLSVWLCSIMAGPALAENTSLRSTLEPGHHRPDSAINYTVYKDEQQHPYTKSVFTYAGDTIKETVYRQKGNSGEWNKILGKEAYAFDASGNQKLFIDWYYYNGKLSSVHKYESDYNSNGMPLYDRSYSLYGDEWMLYAETTCQYDARGLLTGGTFFLTDKGEEVVPLTVSGTPENLEVSIIINGSLYMKTVYHFDPATMKLLGMDYFTVSGVIGEERIATPAFSEEYTYDAAGRVLARLFWNDLYSYKTEYAYDTAGHKLSETESDANSKVGPFAFSRKTEYEYAGGRLERIKRYSSMYPEDGSIPASGSALHEIIVFFYSGDTGNGQVTLAEVSVYPNPVTDVFTVSGVQAGATLTVTSLSGSTVLRQTLTDTQTTLSAASLPPGIYFVTVRSGKGTATYKIIKK